MTDRANPLNAGVTADFDAACAAGLLRPEARESGVLYWLGLCQVLIASLVERGADRLAATQRVREMMVLGLTGLGADAAAAQAIAERSAARL